MVSWTITTSPHFSVNFILAVIGLLLPSLIGWYFLRDWKKAFSILIGFIFIGFSITNSPNEKFSILFPIFTLIANGLGMFIVFSQFKYINKIKKLFW